MKTRNLLRTAAFSMLLAIGLQGALAQNQTVAPGSTFNYTATQSVTGSTFTWSVGANATNAPTTPATISTTSPTGSQSITWPTAAAALGDYMISLTESANTCTGSTSTYVVRVVATSIVITTADASASCAATGASDAITLTFSRTLSGDEFPVTIEANATVNGSAIVYSVATANAISVGTAGTASATATLTFTNAQNGDTTLPLAQVTNQITITKATTAKGGTLTLGADVNYQHPINPIPQTGTITAN